MRHTTWKTIETTPLLHKIYRTYRLLPDSVRTPIRFVSMPFWSLVTWLVLLRSRERVVFGPFKGLTLHLSPVSRQHLLSYVLGTTELELKSVIERIISRGYGTILNVGAADGYYAVGLALKSPSSEVVAFEAKQELHASLADIAERNGVRGRVQIRGTCTDEELQTQLASVARPALVFIDIEGAEREVLDPQKVDALKYVDIMVETHDVYAADCTAILIERFEASHRIERYSARPRTVEDFPPGFLDVIPRFFPRLAVDLMDERRAEQQEWLYMVARETQTAA